MEEAGINDKRIDLEELLDSIAAEGPLDASNTPSHFKHAQRFLTEIETLGALPLLGPENTTVHERYAMHISLFGQLAPYQYKSYLLDPFLENMVRPLITPIQRLIHLVNQGGEREGESMNANGSEVFRMLYIITKTRGFKTVVKFLPHEVADFEPAFAFFCKQDRKDHVNWEIRYMLLVWLSLMCMIPFDLKSVDSGASKDSDRLPLVDTMVETAKSFLDCAGKDRDGSSLFLARLLTRKDTCKTYLPEFVQWCKETMSTEPTIFQAIGVMSTLCWIFKLAQREFLLPIAAEVEAILVVTEAHDKFNSNASVKKLIVKLSQRVGLCLLKPRVATWRYQRGNRSLMANLQLDNTSGIASNNTSMTIATPETEDDEIEVPDEIEGVIERLMNGLRDRNTIVRWSSAKGIGRISNRLPQDMADDVVGSVFELFSEDVFQGPDGELDISAASEHTWHGACLAIAELSQRGLLLPQRLEEIIPWIIRALKFDLKRGAHSVGSAVRDSSCYVCWAFARAYSPEILSSHVRDLSNTLVAVSVFDRDINIRRAASAAFQENVGRMGIFPHGIDIVTIADYFAVGNLSNSFLNVAPEIASFSEYRLNLINHLVNTTISHWDIAVRDLASESLAKMVTMDSEYATQSVIPRLLPMVQSLDPAVRHGALLSLGRICRALTAHLGTPEDQWLPSSEIASVVARTPEVLLSGFGSEHIRQALCVFITCISQAHWKLDGKDLEASRELVHSTLKRTEELLQRLAADTFKAVVDAYDLSLDEFEQCLRNVDPASERFTRRGFALALGEIDYHQPSRAGWLSRTIPALALNAKILTREEMVAPDAQDAESRRNSLNALTNILRCLDSRLQSVVSRQETDAILKLYFTALNDYSVDHRGDVGSWVREASMLGFQVMTPLLARVDRGLPEEQHYLSRADYIQIISILLLESVEKIDRMRAIAAKVLTSLLHARVPDHSGEGAMDQDQTGYLLDVPHRETLMKVFELESGINWLYPGEVYPRVVEFLHLPEYRTDLLAGFVVSAGGLTETLVRHASTCLIEFVGNLAITNVNTDTSTDMEVDGASTPSHSTELTLVEFGNAIMELVAKYEGQDRVIVPLLETLNILLESGVLLLMEGAYEFAPMIRFVQRQTIKCKDVRKLSAAVHVFCGLCGLGGRYKRAITIELLRLLLHPFPKIRKTTADAMYLMMSSSVDEPTPDSEKAAQVIAGTDWNQSIATLTPIRDSLYPLLGLPKPRPVPAIARAAGMYASPVRK
ncbi:hypothetical protein BGZ73_008847 [Actinomortierella ambigua]|nr:hypothetical protein BGZ73_008847 [Actinomortierella ambigua]